MAFLNVTDLYFKANINSLYFPFCFKSTALFLLFHFLTKSHNFLLQRSDDLFGSFFFLMLFRALHFSQHAKSSHYCYSQQISVKHLQNFMQPVLTSSEDDQGVWCFYVTAIWHPSTLLHLLSSFHVTPIPLHSLFLIFSSVFSILDCWAETS